MKNERVGGERVGEGIKERKEEGPGVGLHPMSEILKNTQIAELILLTGAATQTFATTPDPRTMLVAFLRQQSGQHIVC